MDGNLSQDTETSTLPPSPGKGYGSSTSLSMSKCANFVVPTNTFVSCWDGGDVHSWRFEILPKSRHHNGRAGRDKLSEYIERGGGVIDGKVGKGFQEKDKCYTIKILDLEYVRENITRRQFQEIVVPYDCFSSNFIWSQIYQRCNHDVQDVDLNLFRVGPSAHAEFNANDVLKGTRSWKDISPVTPENLLPSITLRDVALQYFPQTLIVSTRKRQVYTRQESQKVLDKVCQLHAHRRVLGLHLYKELSEYHMPNRSFGSLREHFRKTILPHILADDGYYYTSPDDIMKFRSALGDGSNSKRKKTNSLKDLC